MLAAALSTLADAAVASAQYAPSVLTLPSGGTSTVRCTPLPTCATMTACTTCMTLTSSGSGIVSNHLCLPDPLAEVYCCGGPGDCPALSGLPTPTCITVTGVSGISGVCNYGFNVCTDTGVMGPGLSQIAACYTADADVCDPSATVPPGIVDWSSGDCDRDGTPNERDPMPCMMGTVPCPVDAGMPDAGPPDAGAGDGGSNLDAGAPDLGSAPDLGNAPDLGTTGTDAGSPGVDGGGTGMDAGPGGMTFRGSGGCNCSVAGGGAARGALLSALALVGLVAMRRRMRRPAGRV